MTDDGLVKRKNDHLDIVLDARRAPPTTLTGFADYRFAHCALPQLHLDDIDLSTRVFHKPVNAPLLISSMTGGAGGTNWAAVESERATDKTQRRVAMAFAGWGIPTAQAIRTVRQTLPETPLIASGGIRDEVDAAKAIRLGADLVGHAAAVLKSATESSQAVIEHFEVVIQQLRIACFCTGSADLRALRAAVLLDERGVPLEEPHG